MAYVSGNCAKRRFEKGAFMFWKAPIFGECCVNIMIWEKSRFMWVEHSGWNIECGAFRYKVFVDENKLDYELKFEDGSVSKQAGPFDSFTYDWNCDGDVYTQFGAWFTRYYRNGEKNGRDFWTPEQMIACLIEGMDPESREYPCNKIVSIPGIEIPTKDKRPRLDDRMKQTENRAMHQEIEKNRKMNALGIRSSNEPWAR